MGFPKSALRFNFFRLKKTFVRDLEKLFKVILNVILENCHTCLYGIQTSQ